MQRAKAAIRVLEASRETSHSPLRARLEPQERSQFPRVVAFNVFADAQLERLKRLKFRWTIRTEARFVVIYAYYTRFGNAGRVDDRYLTQDGTRVVFAPDLLQRASRVRAFPSARSEAGRTIRRIARRAHARADFQSETNFLATRRET